MRDSPTVPAAGFPALRANEYRDVWCGQALGDRVGSTLRVAGWVHRWRDHGGLIFVDLRDRTGPAEGRVRVAGVRLVVEVDVGIGLEALVDTRGAVRLGIGAVRVGERAAAALLHDRPQPSRGLDDEAADDHRRP